MPYKEVTMKHIIQILLIILFIPLLSYSSTIEEDKSLAELGNSGAAFRLGAKYLNGNGVEKDYKKAKYYLEIAAKKNHSYALYDLGYMYLYGEGVAQDYFKAYEYFERSADYDFPPAYYIMGIMYYDGAGVKQNNKKAYELCKKAIDKGYKTSAIILDHDNKTIIVK